MTQIIVEQPIFDLVWAVGLHAWSKLGQLAECIVLTINFYVKTRLRPPQIIIQQTSLTSRAVEKLHTKWKIRADGDKEC